MQAARQMEASDFGDFPIHFINALNRIEGDYSGMTTAQIRFVMWFAYNTGSTAAEACTALNELPQQGSKVIRALGDRGLGDRPGFQLIEQRHDPADFRVKRIYLTTKGQRLVRDLKKDMGC